MYTLAGMLITLFYVAATATGVLAALYLIIPAAYRAHNRPRHRRGR